MPGQPPARLHREHRDAQGQGCRASGCDCLQRPLRHVCLGKGQLHQGRLYREFLFYFLTFLSSLLQQPAFTFTPHSRHFPLSFASCCFFSLLPPRLVLFFRWDKLANTGGNNQRSSPRIPSLPSARLLAGPWATELPGTPSPSTTAR